jgi:hypothetical protein
MRNPMRRGDSFREKRTPSTAYEWGSRPWCACVAPDAPCKRSCQSPHPNRFIIDTAGEYFAGARR